MVSRCHATLLASADHHESSAHLGDGRRSRIPRQARWTFQSQALVGHPSRGGRRVLGLCWRGRIHGARVRDLWDGAADFSVRGAPEPEPDTDVAGKVRSIETAVLGLQGWTPSGSSPRQLRKCERGLRLVWMVARCRRGPSTAERWTAWIRSSWSQRAQPGVPGELARKPGKLAGRGHRAAASSTAKQWRSSRRISTRRGSFSELGERANVESDGLRKIDEFIEGGPGKDFAFGAEGDGRGLWGSFVGAGMDGVQMTARSWLEHRSRVQQCAGPVR